MKYYLGIDLGGTGIATGVINEDCEIIAKHRVPTNSSRPFEEIVRDMALTGEIALKKAGLKQNQIDYVGIGVPSAINQRDKSVVYANNLNWRNADLIGEFQKFWSIPVYLENDGDAATFAEAMAGAGAGYDNVVMLTLGTGVGGGIILNGKLFTGGDGFGTEPGMITIADGGEPCTSGLHGTFETYASATALVRDTIRAMKERPDSVIHEICGGDFSRVNGRTAFEAARRDDPAGRHVVERYIHYLAVGISSISVLLRPQVVIIGGGIANEGEYLLKSLREAVKPLIYAGDLIGVPKILKARFGNDAGIIGAALLGTRST